MTPRKILFSLFITVLALGSVNAQYDPLYNQYNFDQLMINPAYSAVNDIMSLALLYRQQWTGIQGAPKTGTFTGHTTLAGNRAGVGAMIITEDYGVNTNLEAYANFAYKINFGRGSLAAGVSGGYLNYRYDYSELDLEFDDDPLFNPLSETATQANFGVGLWYSQEDFYIGASIPRILEVEVDQDGGEPSNRYRRHIYLSGGAMLTLNSTLKLKPYTLLRVINGADFNFDIGGNLLIQELIWAGILTRNFDAIVLMGQIELNDQLRLGASFELPTTKLVNDGFATGEIMITYDIAAFSQQVLRRRYF